MPVMTTQELATFLQQIFPQARAERFTFDELRDSFLRFRFATTADDLRPGNTISGPTLMGLSDTGMYLAVLAMIGPVALAVTTSLNINFLRKPSLGELTVETTLLKLGKRLAVGEVFITSANVAGPISHATVTYSIPATR
jgi:acyl-coenzyme A thioesterase PaaI-like protein